MNKKMRRRNMNKKAVRMEKNLPINLYPEFLSDKRNTKIQNTRKSFSLCNGLFPRNKKGVGIAIKPLIAIILVVVVIVVVIGSIVSPHIWDWARNLPAYAYNDTDTVIDVRGSEAEALIANYWYTVAVVLDGTKISFCTNGDCSNDNLQESKLILTGSGSSKALRVLQNGINYNDQIGSLNKKEIKIYSEVLAGIGHLYFDVKDDLPAENFLVNLNGAVFISGRFYRDYEVSIAEKKIEEAEFYLTITKTLQDIEEHYTNLKEGEESNWIKLDILGKVENSKGETGFDSGTWKRDDLEYVMYKKSNGKIYVRFKDVDAGRDDLTPWILLNYWNKYQSFSKVPEGYILK